MIKSQQHSHLNTIQDQVKSVYVYQAPVRLWHWTTVICMIVLIITGIYIGTPFVNQPGDDVDMFFMGYIRFAHFAAGYIFAIGLLGRVLWAVIGNEHARQLFTPPLLSGQWWSEVMFEIRWYFFLEDQPKKYVGHNPLALGMMFLCFVLGGAFLIATGFALYSEGTEPEHWSRFVFGWVNPALGGSTNTHNLHRLAMWVMICFIMVHVYAAIREDIMSRQSIVSSMISGHRTFKD